MRNRLALAGRWLMHAGILLLAVGLPVSHVPAQIGIGVSVLGWAGHALASGKPKARWHPLFVPLLIYLGWNVLSAALSERPAHSLGAVVNNEWPLLGMLMIYWIVDSVEMLARVAYLFLAAASVAMVYAVWQSFAGVEYYRHVRLDPMGSSFYRSVGFYSFYLTFAALAMTVLFLGISLLLETKKWYFAALSMVSGLAVVGSFARSMWLAVLAGLPVLAAGRGKRAVFLLLASVGLVLLGGVGLVPAFRERAGSIFEMGQNATRLNLWRTALKVSAANPVLGIGEDNWDLAFPRYKVEGFYDTNVHPHNDYLTVLVSSGVPGLLAFGVMWGMALGTGGRALRKCRRGLLRGIVGGAQVALVGLLVGGFFQNYYGTFINCLGWWLVVGILLSGSALVEAE
jgi:putative inorganic carbon (hco3(-)) transporter